jgi:N utilization substance protein B
MFNEGKTMAIAPGKLREIVFLLLYGQEVGNDNPADLEEMVMDQLKISKTTVRQGTLRASMILEKQEDVNRILEKCTIGYDVDKISPVERNILRLGIYEIMYDSSIPPKVAIAEGMRLARKFSSTESSKLVNGVLDEVFKKERGE